MTMLEPLPAFLKSRLSWSDLIFRVLLSLIFVIGGLGHFVQHRQMLDRMAESPWAATINTIGNPSILLWLSGIVFIVAGIGLAFGFLTRLSSLLLFITLIPVTITMHIAPGHAGPLFKNIAILGALIHFFFRGGGTYAIDNLLPGVRLSSSTGAKDLVANANSEVQTIPAASVAGMINDPNVVLVDLREADELSKSGKLEGAMHDDIH
jgi:putative oxidoreductase